jgi:ketosteroid isomerase-like protein
MTRRALLVTTLALACAPVLLPGTEIPDTPDTRAVAAVVEAYRQAVERLDAPAILAMASPDYLDTAGTPDLSDDVNYAGLAKRLEDLKDLQEVRLQFTLRRIEVRGDGAICDVFFDQYYRVKTPSGTTVPRRDTDIHRLALKRVKGKWLFTSGL